MSPNLEQHAARLLGRALVDIQAPPLEDARVLVTGAAGSIGEALVTRLCDLGVAHVTALDRAETRLFRLGERLRATRPTANVELALADVCDRHSVARAFARARPTVVLHAAAYKHVPMLEAFPRAAILNNLSGTRVIADACADAGAKLVFISTDKAVAPISVMGASKRACELYLAARSSQDSAFTPSTVRFGNVLGSRGSVLEILSGQLDARAPMTLTHPEMRRFFLAPGEAVGFVLWASSAPDAAGVYVLDTGAPLAITDLARRLASDPDQPIVFIGARPGERLEERLMHDDERRVSTSHPHVVRLEGAEASSGVLAACDALCELARSDAPDPELLASLSALVPSLERVA